MVLCLPCLPSELVASVLQFLPLPDLPSTLVALGTTCRACAEHLSEASVVWGILLPLISAPESSCAPIPPTRKSARLASASPKETFTRAWRSVLTRAEAVHHQVACAGQDSKDLGVSRLRRLIARHGPWLLVDRASPIYNATLLMETCRARGIREADHVAIADYIINSLGADPSARPSSGDACTPLIIASCRGLPRLAAFLLACGADTRPRGRGRFRLCGRSQSLAGCHTALEWTERLLEAEIDAGVSADHRRALAVTQRLLRLVHTEGSEGGTLLLSASHQAEMESLEVNNPRTRAALLYRAALAPDSLRKMR